MCQSPCLRGQCACKREQLIQGTIRISERIAVVLRLTLAPNCGRGVHDTPLDREANCQATLKHCNRAAREWRTKLPELRKRRCPIPYPPDQN